MAEKIERNESGARKIPSDLAGPSRPGGYHGVRQPIQPDDTRAKHTPAKSGPVLEKIVDRALRHEGSLRDHNVSVSAFDGVVVLQGEVPLEFQRTLATALAAEVPGVLTVHNRLTVSEY